MAKFLNTSGVTYYLEELIKETSDRLILISPYLQFNERIKEHIRNLNLLKRDIRIIYKENKLQPEETNFLAEQMGVRTSLCKNLHAKCYLNEKGAIITSMNLYEFSQSNNNEMGIYIRRDEDPELYKQVVEEADRLLKISEEIRITVQKVVDIKSNSSKKEKEPGYCIRTGIKIPFNPEKPLSKEAFQKWNQYSDEDYPEKYCHYSGEPSDGETSMAKPVLRKNWNKAKETFKF